MGKTKDSDLAILEPTKTKKPVVKDYEDRDAKIKAFVLSRLLHVPRSTATLRKVYQNKSNSVYRFRVNYHRSEYVDGNIVPNNSIVASRYVEVRCTEPEWELIDKN